MYILSLFNKETNNIRHFINKTFELKSYFVGYEGQVARDGALGGRGKV
jgi:hypothetical protein